MTATSAARSISAGNLSLGSRSQRPQLGREVFRARFIANEIEQRGAVTARLVSAPNQVDEDDRKHKKGEWQRRDGVEADRRLVDHDQANKHTANQPQAQIGSREVPGAERHCNDSSV